MISALHIDNFKCFVNERIPLEALTLLTGLNGGGKSTLIQALTVLRQSHTQGMLTHEDARLALNGDAVRLGAGADVLNEGANDRDGISLGVEWKDGHRARWNFAYASEEDVLMGEQVEGESAEALRRIPFHPARGREALDEPTVDYLSADRLGPRAAFEMADYQVGLRGVGPRGQYATHFLAAFGEQNIPIAALERPLGEGQRDASLLAQVGAWLQIISPGVRLEAETLRRLDAARLGFQTEAPYGWSRVHRPTNVGFGLTYVLPVLTLLLSAAPGSLIMLENPEAHLHPRGQFEFARLIARTAAAGVQCLVETHSDHILNGVRVAVAESDDGLPARDAVVHYFERGLRETASTRQTLRIQPDGSIADWPDGFFDQYRLALLQLMGG